MMGGWVFRSRVDVTIEQAIKVGIRAFWRLAMRFGDEEGGKRKTETAIEEFGDVRKMG
jgi:hypothetical protein